VIDRRLHYASRLGRNPSRLRLMGTPVALVMLGSMATAIPVIAQSPVLPPFGLILLLVWRLLRPELWRAWHALPLGLFDDMMSGQPIGSAMCLWTLILIAVDFMEHRLIWRDWRQDWLIASVAIIIYVLASAFFVHITGGGAIRPALMIPQMLWSVLLFPFIVRQCARIDRWRLMA